MGKYRRYKNRVEMYLSSEKGKRILNFAYSWGASIVIIGTMFKLLHLPYANWIIGIALSVEALIFFIFGFEKPGSEYHWEDVFPILKSKNPMDRPDFSDMKVSAMINSEANAEDDNMNASTKINMSGGDSFMSADDTKKISDATQKYLEQLSSMSQNMERFSQVTNSLTDVSDTLLNSYKSITDNSDGLSQSSRGYVQQMEALNRNISGLNTIYEIQLKGVSSHLDTIEHINNGLNRIKEMYDGSVVDSSVFRSETDKMTRQLVELNKVYGRLLQAMTVNMPGANPYQQQQPPQQQNPYTQQQGYGQQQPPMQDPYQSPYNNPVK